MDEWARKMEGVGMSTPVKSAIMLIPEMQDEYLSACRGRIQWLCGQLPASAKT